MTHVFHRHIGSNYPKAVSGDGVYLIDDAGKRYIDASGGAAVSCLGHSDADVRRAISGQLDDLAFAHTSFFTNDAMEQLSDLLVELAPGNLNHVYPVSGGSEAMESAIKMARQYFVEKGEKDRCHIIARRQSYHGNTLGVLATGGNQLRREKYESLLIDVTHISPCYAYRGQNDDETPEAYGLRVADELESAVQKLGPNTVMAFVAETVVGASLGAVAPTPGYFKRVREICNRHGIILILDEVMCGMGRTGTTFAFEQEGIVPDLVAIAKGLAGGYQPLGALLVCDEIYDTIKQGSGFFEHGHTYIGHALACVAGLAAQRTIIDRNLLANVRTQGENLMAMLQQKLGQHPNIGDIRGRGLFLGLELVKDRESKQTFDPALKLSARIRKAGMSRGLICYPMGGTADGKNGDHILLAPPYIVDASHLEEISDKLTATVDDALGGVAA